jgi:uncharacterized membrane protein HdeD (DUF308 family)
MMDFIDARFFEMLFLLCFGLSWPMNIVKAVRSKTSKGVSLWFLCVCFLGYVFGIISKLVDTTLSYTLIFYCINICMVGTCIVFYFINSRNDKIADARKKQ